MITKLLTRDISLILAASFFYMACPMMVTPLIAGFSESLGASAVLMGLVGGMMNVVSLCCRPFVGNLADKISKYRLSTIGSLLMIVACIGYIFAPTPAVVVGARIINGVRSEEHTSELQSRLHLVCRLLLEKNFFNDTATTEIYTLSLHDALPI